jgi:acyl dehydratase
MITTVLEVEAWNQHGVSVGVARGRSLSYEDRGAAPEPATPAADPATAGAPGGGFAVGRALPGLTVAGTTLEDVVRWSGAIDDYSDIHYDPAAAAGRGLAGPVVNGPWKAALLLRMLGDWAGERGTVTALDCRYRRADVVGGPLACGGVVTSVTADGAHDLVACDVWVTNGEGTPTVTGTATVRVLRPLSANDDEDGAVLATGALKAALRLGQEAGRFTYRVERGDIERFLAAIGDPVERWADPADPDRLVAPPTFFAALDPVERRELQIEQALDDIPYAKTGGGNAFNEVEYERPIREGDVITVVTSYAEVYERAGRAGRLLFRVRHNDYLDAGGALVARTRMGHVLAYDLDRMAR